MKTIDDIKGLNREDLEEFRLECFDEFDNLLPFYILKTIQTLENIDTVSNGFFRLILSVPEPLANIIYGSTSSWLDHDTIKGWMAINLPINSEDSENSEASRSRFVFFLTSVQYDIIKDLKVGSYEERFYLDKLRYKIPTTVLTPEELEHPICTFFVYPNNSESITVSDNTSRFSGAIWYEAIQKKVITLAGLGGIGSYVAFLLARMNPTSIFIYDDDVVESANMSGQLYSLADVDSFKVDAMANMVSSYANYNSIFAIREKFTTNSEASDIMICGFDNMMARNIFFHNWKTHVENKEFSDRKNCLFIDGRLSAEYLQVYALRGDDDCSITKYANTALFSDSEADETVCSYKQTTYMANMIGSIIVNIFTNFVANELVGAPIREFPYLTTYDGNSMQLKIE